MFSNVANLLADLPSGTSLFSLAEDLFPIHRSLTGEGVRVTLRKIQQILPELVVHEISSGSQVFDWTIPDEWSFERAQLWGPNDELVLDTAINNLHVLQYSMPIDVELSLKDLEPHLHSLPDNPRAIPYVTSYYKPDWGFCLSHEQRLALSEGKYRAVIKSTLRPGVLNFADLVVPGQVNDEILISTYICHPQMANNEISGPVVATFLAQWISTHPRYFTYRFVFVPETIGTITYLSKHLDHLQKTTKAGFVMTCCGDPGEFSLMPSRTGNTYADRLAETVLSQLHPDFRRYSFLERGSDERQYCAPLIDLPVASIMRSKYHDYAEYHTSLDDLSFITPDALRETLEVYAQIVLAAEHNCMPRPRIYGEPHLSKYGLYPTTGGQVNQSVIGPILDVLALSDGATDLLTLAAKLSIDVVTLREIVDLLQRKGLLEY